MLYFKEPNKFRFGRKQKGKIGDSTSRGTEIKFGSYGLRVLKEGIRNSPFNPQFSEILILIKVFNLLKGLKMYVFIINEVCFAICT